MIEKLKHTVLVTFLLFGMMAFSQKVVDLEMSACERNSYPALMHRNRLIQKKLKNDTLILQVGIGRNCSFSPKVNLVYANDTLILKISNTSSDYAACDCCYELKLRIVGISDTNFTLGEKLTNYDFLDGDLLDGELKEWTEFAEFNYYQNKFIFPTLEEVEAITEYNQVNADSLKIEWWIEYSDRYPNNYSKIFYFIDELGKSRAKWEIGYNEKQEITAVHVLTGIDRNGISNVHQIEGQLYMELTSTKQ